MILSAGLWFMELRKAVQCLGQAFWFQRYLYSKSAADFSSLVPSVLVPRAWGYHGSGGCSIRLLSLKALPAPFDGEDIARNSLKPRKHPTVARVISNFSKSATGKLEEPSSGSTAVQIVIFGQGRGD